MRSRVFPLLLLDCFLFCFSKLLRTVSSEQPVEDLQVRFMRFINKNNFLK